MKNKMIALLTCLSFIASSDAQKYSIKGNFTTLKGDYKVLLTYTNFADSTVTKNGKFFFSGTVEAPVKAILEIKSLNDDGVMSMEKILNMDVQSFFLENINVSVNGVDKMKTATIKGGGTQKDFLLLQAQLKPLNDEMKPINDKMAQFHREKNENAKDELFPQLWAIKLRMDKVEDSFIYRNPNSYVSLNLMQKRASNMEVKTFEPLFKNLSSRLRNTDAGKEMEELLAIAKRVGIGQIAPNFTQNDKDANPFSLYSLKGKYVLIDFWASWCGPCRAENPHVVKAYEQFKDKNFEIVGVSLDNKSEPWLAAITKDGLPWINLSDLKGWNNEVVKLYGVKSVPQNFLLDPQGKIIARNLRGAALQKKLETVLK